MEILFKRNDLVLRGDVISSGTSSVVVSTSDMGILQTIEVPKEDILPKSHGGYRTGAGRKRKEEKAIQITLTIPPALLNKLKTVEGQNLQSKIIKICNQF